MPILVAYISPPVDAEYSEVLEGSAHHLCDAQASGGAPEERELQTTPLERATRRSEVDAES